MPLRIGQDVPGFLARLTHVGGLGADSQQTLKLFILVSIGGVHVDMQRQLPAFGLSVRSKTIVGWSSAEAFVLRADLDAVLNPVPRTT